MTPDKKRQALKRFSRKETQSVKATHHSHCLEINSCCCCCLCEKKSQHDRKRRTHTHAYTHIHIHTRTRARTHTHTHMHARASKCGEVMTGADKSAHTSFRQLVSEWFAWLLQKQATTIWHQAKKTDAETSFQKRNTICESDTPQSLLGN